VKDGVGLNEAAGTYLVPQNTKLSRKLWFASFMKRHHKLSLRQPELPSLATVYGFNDVVVHTNFGALESIVNENKITGLRIFNIDETSHTAM
jgi:hypothetical protein